MDTNAFDPKTMPSARPARDKERRMFGGVPLYAVIVILVAVCILGVLLLAATQR